MKIGKKKSGRINFIERAGVLLFAAFLLAGCTTNVAEPKEQEKDEMKTGFIPERPGMYDSADTAVIVHMDKTKEEIVFFNNIVKKNYTLQYDGVSKTLDKYGETISMDQFETGELVDIHFLKGKKKLASIQKSPSASIIKEVSHPIINEKKKEMTIGKESYQYDDNLFIFSEGKQIELMDVNEADLLTIVAVNRKIYSIRVEQGHGYLRLKNEENMIGGWIEVGNSVIHKIEEGMLLVVPEGSYEVYVSKGSLHEKRKVTIKRDKETELDLGDLCKEEEKVYGNLIFVVSPVEAAVYIDGEKIDTSVPFQAEYGVHQLMVKAQDYQTMTQYIKVDQPNATIQLSLKAGEKDTVSGNEPTEPKEDTAVSTTGGKLTIVAPEGVELYMDGNYIGLTKATVKKTKGLHVIVLRKSGFVTRSYTINIENVETDQTMSFQELKKEEVEKDESEDEEKKSVKEEE